MTIQHSAEIETGGADGGVERIADQVVEIIGLHAVGAGNIVRMDEDEGAKFLRGRPQGSKLGSSRFLPMMFEAIIVPLQSEFCHRAPSSSAALFRRLHRQCCNAHEALRILLDQFRDLIVLNRSEWRRPARLPDCRDKSVEWRTAPARRRPPHPYRAIDARCRSRRAEKAGRQLRRHRALPFASSIGVIVTGTFGASLAAARRFPGSRHAYEYRSFALCSFHHPKGAAHGGAIKASVPQPADRRKPLSQPALWAINETPQAIPDHT